jgi:hypothetical protein
VYSGFFEILLSESDNAQFMTVHIAPALRRSSVWGAGYREEQ